jgi:hypothetical protein
MVVAAGLAGLALVAAEEHVVLEITHRGVSGGAGGASFRRAHGRLYGCPARPARARFRRTPRHAGVDTFSRITGYPRDEVLGRNPRMLNSGRHDREFYAAVWRALTGKGHWHGEIRNRRKDGALYAEMFNISAVCDGEGQTQHHVASRYGKALMG